jgi:hypothetical protein
MQCRGTSADAGGPTTAAPLAAATAAALADAGVVGRGPLGDLESACGSRPCVQQHASPALLHPAGRIGRPYQVLKSLQSI